MSSSRPAPRVLAGRDHAVDLVRAVCVVAVVVLHALMVGVTVAADGPIFANAGETGWWLTPISWVLQVMPLFFVIGGFAGYTAYERMRGRHPEGAGVSFVVGRIHRLLLPAIAVIAAAGVGLALLTLVGVPADLVGVAGYRFGQPLWFLAVFLLAQALLPLLARAHRAAPLVTLALLSSAALLVDVVRAATGIEGIGFLNLGFVWLSMQQLGFLLADGRVDALSSRARTRILGIALALLAVSFTTGFHSPDLIANINPPTTALILVGVVHTCAFSLLRAPLAAVAVRPRVAAVTGFISERAMTIYLWHMTVLLALAGVSAVLASAGLLALPAPASPEWWQTRPLWLALALGLTALISVPLSRVEALRPQRRPAGAVRVGVAAALGTAGVTLLLVQGASTTTVLVAVAALLGAVALVTRIGAREVQVVVQGAPRVEGGRTLGTAIRGEILGDRHDVSTGAAEGGLDVATRRGPDSPRMLRDLVVAVYAGEPLTAAVKAHRDDVARGAVVGASGLPVDDGTAHEAPAHRDHPAIPRAARASPTSSA